MKRGIYGTLALTGIQKNKKLYYPYMLACIVTVMMCYIISFLSKTPALTGLNGGEHVQILLGLGFGVMSVFSVIFLFYTNSFLIRRRKKEFGLYNILGLGKKHLAIVLFMETLIIASVSVVGGLFLGILFSKFAELCLVKIIGGSATVTMNLGMKSIVQTIWLFIVAFGLLFLNTLMQVKLTNPIQLLHSENVGEKPPKANWLIAILGVVILGIAYYLAVSIEEPLTAFMLFTVAVIMVIVATYLLFIAGSVALCRLLQKNKHYYYQTNHFVSLSSMVYRMKRNGAGLANICILSTMVLVMVSSTACLYIGMEDSLRNRYPRHITVEATASSEELLQGERVEKMQSMIQQTVEEAGLEQMNVLEYCMATFTALVQNNQVMFADEHVYSGRNGKMSELCLVFLVSLSDYNRLTGNSETLAPGEALLYATRNMNYEYDTVQLNGEKTLSVVKQVEAFEANGVSAMQIVPSLFLFVEDFEAALEPFSKYTQEDGSESVMKFERFYGFDLTTSDKEEISIWQRISQQVYDLRWSDGTDYVTVFTECVADGRAAFYGIYGGLFFLGILLGIVFAFAAVLIIYYKQISEGYEDRSRFDIMQKVGMTKHEIKRSINAQVRLVFFLPLLMAGVHLAFAFPLISKLMALLHMTNVTLFVITIFGCYSVFGIFYMIVYRMTSRSYFSIASSKDIA